MEKQKKNDSGITLVALVVSIIVMLVLAGVSLNATIGENGIVTRAQEAALQHKAATDLEELNLELAKLNVDTLSSDETLAIQDIANYLVSQGTIDRFITTSAGQIAAGIDTTTGNKYFFGIKGDNTFKIDRGRDDLYSAILTDSASGGDITGGYTLVTADSFNNDSSLPETEKGKFTITSDAEVVFMDTVSGALSIAVADNVHATVGIYADMTLSNQGVKRSAIDISKNNGILDLYVGEGVNITVNSGLGEDASGNVPGKGGYAGIHVPPGATINIKASREDDSVPAQIIAIGGNAGEGGTPIHNSLSAGGGGAGAGIGGIGGTGGTGARGVGTHGGNAEGCGNVNIYGNVVVNAYGGAGGSGGSGSLSTAEDGDGQSGGAGGYPGAGIGGGGAGGAGASCCAGGGGYSGGTPEYILTYAHNGLAAVDTNTGRLIAGGGYFEGSYAYDSVNTTWARHQLCLAGFGSVGAGTNNSHTSGNGGNGGTGGTVKVSKNAKVYAFNGNIFTDGVSGHEYNNGINECPFYGQCGIYTAKYYYSNDSQNETKKMILSEAQRTNIALSGYVNNKFLDSTNFPAYANVRYMNVNDKVGTTNNTLLTNVDMSKQGVGTGAGYTEISNGSYTVYNEDVNGNFTTVYTEE